MRLTHFLCLILTAASSGPLVGQTPPNVVRIDGSETPEKIPDHTVWKSNFVRLSEIKKAGGEKDLAWDLPLSQADADALYKEAALQPQRDQECQAHVTARLTELRESGAAPDALARALTEVEIECRSKDLDAADRVMDGLSPEGRTTLAAWIEKGRRTIVMFVPSQDMATYRLPR